MPKFATNLRTRARALRSQGRFRTAFAIYRLLGAVFSINRLVLILETAFYGAAVKLHLPWPRAHLWWGQRAVKKLSRFVDSGNYEKSKAEDI